MASCRHHHHLFLTVDGGLTVAMSEKEGHNLAHSTQIAATKLSLVLDLDYTLVHASNDVQAAKPHLILSS